MRKDYSYVNYLRVPYPILGCGVFLVERGHTDRIDFLSEHFTSDCGQTIKKQYAEIHRNNRDPGADNALILNQALEVSHIQVHALRTIRAKITLLYDWLRLVLIPDIATRIGPYELANLIGQWVFKRTMKGVVFA